jgi:hypothetical protein
MSSDFQSTPSKSRELLEYYFNTSMAYELHSSQLLFVIVSTEGASMVELAQNNIQHGLLLTKEKGLLNYLQV